MVTQNIDLKFENVADDLNDVIIPLGRDLADRIIKQRGKQFPEE